MAAVVINGRVLAAELLARVEDAVCSLTSHHIVPGLAVVLVNNDPASEIYVANKKKMAVEVGIRTVDHCLPASTSEVELLSLIDTLNKDVDVHGILVQLPLPPQIDIHAVITAIDPAKDVDGFHPLNVGRIARGLPALRPCTPSACIALAKSAQVSFAGLNAVVIGRSLIVGRPLAQLLIAEDATVTVAHSKTKEVPSLARQADLLFVAIGRREFVKNDWIKPGATVIDVGVNRVMDGRPRVVGDVAFEEVRKISGAITPVPGGVGPMTIACLLANTVEATCALSGLPAPRFEFSK
jgi:methylenetetrahydrofolate dehydrogenase (NADP+) / methenyltetrahydrofolate cyclohydrolase